MSKPILERSDASAASFSTTTYTQLSSLILSWMRLKGGSVYSLLAPPLSLTHHRDVESMVLVSKATLSEFLARRPFSVVHFDAQWDGLRMAVQEKLRAIEPQFADNVSFGYVDIDTEQEYAGELRIIQIPSIAYYKGTTLCGVTGGMHEISDNIQCLLAGMPLAHVNKPNNEFTVPVVSKDGVIVDGTFLIDEERRSLLTLSFGDRSITREAIDVYESFLEIRRELERDQINVLCYGACRNVWPSGMSRDMGGGVLAYRHMPGQTASNEMVHIFAKAADIDLVTVAEQQEYAEQWSKSIRRDEHSDQRAYAAKEHRWFLYILGALFVFLIIWHYVTA